MTFVCLTAAALTGLLGAALRPGRSQEALDDG